MEGVPLSKQRRCRMCGFTSARRAKFSWHHLIPRSEFWVLGVCPHGKSNRVYVCVTCHSRIHFLFNNWELGQSFFTIGVLKKGLKKRMSERMYEGGLTKKQWIIACMA